MTALTNQQVLANTRSLVEAVNRHDAVAVASHYAPNSVQILSDNTKVSGREGVTAYFAALFTAFPDLKMELKDVLVTAPNKVAVEYTLSGTHLGPHTINGQHVPPSGRAFSLVLLNTATLDAEGRVTEAKVTGDSGAMARQLGLIEPMLPADQRIAMARKFYQAISGGDIEGIMACYAPTAHYSDNVTESLDREEIKALWAFRFKTLPAMKAAEKEIAVSGFTVVARHEITATAGTLPNGTTPNKAVQFEVVDLFKIGPLGIVEHRSYYDQTSVEKQLGLIK